MIELGQKVRDRITGFEGIVTSKVEYLNGCIQYCVKPKVREGKITDGEYIDEEQLEIITEDKTLKTRDPQRKSNGGDMSDTPKANYRG